MIRLSSWLAPPTRREIILSAFCAFTFTFSFLASFITTTTTTFEDQLRTLPLSRLGFSAQTPKPSTTTARLLDSEIFGVTDTGSVDADVLYGNFPWLPHHVADDPFAKGRAKPVEYYTEENDHVKWWNRSFVVGAPKSVKDYQVWPYSSFWMSVEERERLWGSFETLKAGERVHEAFWRWDDGGDDGPGQWRGPVSKIVKHVSGFAVIDNVYLYNGVVHIVTDEPASSLPDLKTIVTPESGSHSNWAYISTREARERLGFFAGIIKGVSWMIMDTEPHNETLLGLQKLQYSVRSTKPQLPTRLIHPNLPTFSDPNPDRHDVHDEVVPRRRRSDTGYHPYTLKAAFPTLAGTLFKEDWEDYVLTGLKEQKRTEKPGWVLETVIVGCVASLTEGQSVGDRTEVFKKGDRDSSSDDFEWFRQPRENLENLLGMQKKAGVMPVYAKTMEVTVLMPTSHSKVAYDALLTWLERDPRFKLNILSPSSGWREKMEAFLETDVLVCLEAGGAAEAVWMTPVKGTVIVQSSQDGIEKAIVESLGIKYVGVSSLNEVEKVFEGLL